MNRFFFFLLLLIGPLNSDTTLLIKIPTRGRYVQFFNALDQYYAKLSNTLSVHFVISCDHDDPVMNSPEAKAKFNTYPHLHVHFGNSKTKIEACNQDLDKHPDFHILLLGSDDMIPIVQGYDEIIFRSMKEHFPNFDGVLHFDDGFQGINLNTLPVLGKKYYDQFGYIYYPEYITYFCDNEFMEVSRRLKKAVYINSVIIEHRHPSLGKGPKDELFIRNEKTEYTEHDFELYSWRSIINFGLPR